MNRRVYTLLLWVPVLFAVVLLGCNNDPCKDVDCQNGGDCINGRCFCPDGFSGELCEESNPCDTIDCENGGTCVDGICECECGYSGLTCSDHITDPFTGIFTASRVCGGVSELYSVTISKANTDCEGMIISNFYNTGSSATAEVTLSSFAIMPVQSFDIYTVTNGSLSVNNQVVTITFDIEDNLGNSESCVITCNRN